MNMTFALIVVLFKKIFSKKSSHFLGSRWRWHPLEEEIQLKSLSLTIFSRTDSDHGTSCQTPQKRYFL